MDCPVALLHDGLQHPTPTAQHQPAAPTTTTTSTPTTTAAAAAAASAEHRDEAGPRWRPG